MLGRRRSFLLCVLAISTAAAAPAAAEGAATEMPWHALDRFGGDRNGDGRLDGSGVGRFRGLDEFPLVVRPSPLVCAYPQRASWSVDGKPLEGVETGGEPRRCHALLAVAGEGPHEVEVRAGGQIEVAHVDVNDRLIVALGDSVASGEGNPRGDTRWLDAPCHRSGAAGFEQAARRLANGSNRISITFVSLACSGAKVGAGLLEPYAGVAPRKGVAYAPQVDRLESIAAARGGGGGAVDAVLVSVGANDLGFSRVVAACGAPGDCRERKQRQVFESLASLPKEYDRFGRRLAEAAPGAPVLIAEYFDPTHDEGGDFCDSSVAFTTREEAQWAYEGLLRPLNVDIATAAVRNGWQRVGGIAAAYEHHGYCAEGRRRWVRRLSESAFAQGDLKGTLHPNERGQLEIAWRVLPPLAAALDLIAPNRPPEEEDGLSAAARAALLVLVALAAVAVAVLIRTLASTPLAGWPRAILGWLFFVLLAPFALAFFAMLRLLRLLRPTDRDDPGPAGTVPRDIKQVPRPQGSWQVVMVIGGLVLLLVLAALFARQVGSTILWLRFWSSNLPADQAVAAVSERELVVTGAQEISLFLGLGLLALGGAWLLDGKGRWTRATRRGLLTIALVEIVAAILIGNFRDEQTYRLLGGLVLVALLLHFLLDRAITPGSIFRSGQPPLHAVRLRWQARWSAPAGEFWKRLPLRLWHVLPFAVLAAAVIWSLRADGHDRDALALVFGLAALLFVAPGGLAAPGTQSRQASPKQLATLETPRIGLALAAVACLTILIVRDEAWLAATAAMALVLALLCLAISAASKNRFAPYGLAVLVSVPLFGAGAAMVRGIDTPELQPVAAVLRGGPPVCGAYVGESGGRLWMARLSLAEEGDERRPRGGRLFSVDATRVASRLLGPLEPATRAEAQAAALRDELLDERGERLRRRWPTCAPPPTVARAQRSWQRRLAERFQPELVLDRRDGFWPVPVKTLFSVADRRAGICRQVAAGAENCLRLTTQGRFPWAGGQGEAIEYPAADTDIDAQYDQMVDALGSADPDRTATEYFFVAGGPGRDEPITIQYWFFYPFNYQPLRGKVLQGGFHEGDFESVGVLLSAKTREPRYFWMARHDEEGRILPWGDDAMTLSGDHAQVFVARGSHASYETCADQIRYAAKYHLVDDHPTCDADHQLYLSSDATRLTDLSKVSWACWHGNFGHRSGGRTYEQIPYLVADAPRSPLWQQHFGGVVSEPCRGLADPGGRDGPGEEVLKESDRVPAKLRERGGRLEPLVNRCTDWQVPPPTGTFMLACDPVALRPYVRDGFEGPTDGVRIETAGRPGSGGRATLPAVRRDREATYLDEWRVIASRPARVTVFASCPHAGGIVAVRFPRVPVSPAEPLRLLDQTPDGWWRLIREDGTRVARSKPFPTRQEGGRLVQARGHGERLTCSAS
jgi:lysophospholipase L1-like esterase